MVIKDNVASKRLRDYCETEGIHYIDKDPGSGFGRNNNIVYRCCEVEYGLTDDDIFLVVNPDIVIEVRELQEFSKFVEECKIDLATLSLYNDASYDEIQASVRDFPNFVSFIKSFVMGPDSDLCADSPGEEVTRKADWCSGAFVMFRAGLYKKLEGFDERYFMYCEDIDICYRANAQLGVDLLYIPQFQAIHIGNYQNRNVFSKHFYWHVLSVLRYLFTRSKKTGY